MVGGMWHHGRWGRELEAAMCMNGVSFELYSRNGMVTIVFMMKSQNFANVDVFVRQCYAVLQEAIERMANRLRFCGRPPERIDKNGCTDSRRQARLLKEVLGAFHWALITLEQTFHLQNCSCISCYSAD